MQIEGRNPVLETLRSDKVVGKIYLQKDLNQDTKINELVKKAKRDDVKIVRKSKKELDKISVTGAHQGVIAYAKHVQSKNLAEVIEEKYEKRESVKILYIREAYHEYNIGAIIRTAECCGFDAVILPPKINVTSQVVRSSMGASEHIPVYSHSLFPLIKMLSAENFKIVGIERTEEANKYTESDLTGDIMLIIGGEDKPLSEEITNKCDNTVVIPMRGKVNSLNMSVAAALVMYECLRQEEG